MIFKTAIRNKRIVKTLRAYSAFTTMEFRVVNQRIDFHLLNFSQKLETTSSGRYQEVMGENYITLLYIVVLNFCYMLLVETCAFKSKSELKQAKELIKLKSVKIPTKGATSRDLF